MNNLYKSRGPQNLYMSTFVGKVGNYPPALKYKYQVLSTGAKTPFCVIKKNQTKCHSKNTRTKRHCDHNPQDNLFAMLGDV